jgi:uncharacterized protein
MTEQKHFFLRLNPPRATFMQDMTIEEKSIMQRHVAYWNPYLEDGTVIVMGPVYDHAGGFGMAVVVVDSEDQVQELIDLDPAKALGQYDIFPMRAVTK